MSDAATAEANSATEPKANNSPVFAMRINQFDVAVFEDQRSTKEGRVFKASSIKIRKTWKTGDSYDERTMYLDPQDVQAVKALLDQAYLACYDQD